MLGQMVDEPVLVLPKLEEIIRFRDFSDFSKNLRPRPIRETIRLLLKLLLPGGIKALIFRLINFSAIEQLLEDLAHDPLMAFFRRPNEVVVGNIQPRQ